MSIRSLRPKKKDDLEGSLDNATVEEVGERDSAASQCAASMIKEGEGTSVQGPVVWRGYEITGSFTCAVSLAFP